MRSSKVYFLLKHIGEFVTAFNISLLGNGTTMRGHWGDAPKIVDCNEFWVTLQTTTGAPPQSFILRDVDLNFDHPHSRLQIEITTRQL